MDPTFSLDELISQAREIDPQARDDLLARYRNYLRMVARIWIDRTLPVPLEPSDAVQETLLRAHRGFEQFHGCSERELIVWLRRILANYLIDAARQARTERRSLDRERSLESDLEQSAVQMENCLQWTGSSPSQQAQRRELVVVLADALDRLSDEHRDVIVLRSLQELDWATVARRMDRTPDAARMLWTRALRELRPHLEASV